MPLTDSEWIGARISRLRHSSTHLSPRLCSLPVRSHRAAAPCHELVHAAQLHPVEWRGRSGPANDISSSRHRRRRPFDAPARRRPLHVRGRGPEPAESDPRGRRGDDSQPGLGGLVGRRVRRTKRLSAGTICRVAVVLHSGVRLRPRRGGRRNRRRRRVGAARCCIARRAGIHGTAHAEHRAHHFGLDVSGPAGRVIGAAAGRTGGSHGIGRPLLVADGNGAIAIGRVEWRRQRHQWQRLRRRPGLLRPRSFQLTVRPLVVLAGQAGRGGRTVHGRTHASHGRMESSLFRRFVRSVRTWRLRQRLLDPRIDQSWD